MLAALLLPLGSVPDTSESAGSHRCSSNHGSPPPTAHCILGVAGTVALRTGLQEMLEAAPDFHVVAEMSDQELLAAPAQLAPDLILIAVNSTLETTPMALVHACQERYPAAKILLLADPAAEPHLAACLAAGAAGLFPLDLEAAPLLQAVRAVLTYGLVLHPRMIPVIRPYFTLRPAQRSIPLTEQEYEILHLMATGATNADIAVALSLAPHTVVKYVSRLLRKLEVPNRTAAVARALREGLIE